MSSFIQNQRHERRILSREEGQALVEFALVLPLLLMLVLGLADFGRALSFKNDQTHLASETARYAVVNNCPATCTSPTTLNTLMKNQAESSTVAVSVCYPPNTSTGTSGKQGDPLHVTVRDTFNWLPVKLKLSALGIDWNPAVSTNIVSNSEMRLEWDPTSGTPVYNIGTWDSTSKTCS